MRRSFLMSALAFLAQLALPSPVAIAADIPSRRLAAKVALVEGDARFVDGSGAPRRPRAGDVLYEGDSIVTGPDGEVQLAMEDGGYIGVRPDSQAQVVTFRADGGPDDVSVISLMQGSLRVVTGWIAALGGGTGGTGAVVRTPAAAIGVRGTDHEALVVPEGATHGEPGTYDRVHAGETVIETRDGKVAVKAGQAGFAPLRAGAAPRVLERVPELFRPTRNESRFEGLHERVRDRLDRRGDDRGRSGGLGRRGERGERIELDDRRRRPERAERPERPERMERPERPERSGHD